MIKTFIAFSLFLLLLMPTACTVSNGLSTSSRPAKPHLKVADYLASISGKKTVAGIHNREPNLEPAHWTNQIEQLTGKCPGLWSGDFLFQADNINNRQIMVNEALAQWKKGSLINIMWHACNPALQEPCGWDDQGVKSKLTDGQWKELTTSGTPLNKRWKERVDEVCVYLKFLKDNGVEVLWRPLHEMNQGVFWWGGRPGPEGTRKLWQLMHDYMTNEKGLDNLVWVWDIQDFPTLPSDAVNYNPGPGYWDIAALDVYDDNTGYSPEKYRIMQQASGGKPIAIGECQKYPSPKTLAEQPKWTFFMGWSELVFSANTPGEIKDVITAPNVLSRDEMPGWESMGN